MVVRMRVGSGQTLELSTGGLFFKSFKLELLYNYNLSRNFVLLFYLN